MQGSKKHNPFLRKKWSLETDLQQMTVIAMSRDGLQNNYYKYIKLFTEKRQLCWLKKHSKKEPNGILQSKNYNIQNFKITGEINTKWKTVQERIIKLENWSI